MTAPGGMMIETISTQDPLQGVQPGEEARIPLSIGQLQQMFARIDATDLEDILGVDPRALEDVSGLIVGVLKEPEPVLLKSVAAHETDSPDCVTLPHYLVNTRMGPNGLRFQPGAFRGDIDIRSVNEYGEPSSKSRNVRVDEDTPSTVDIPHLEPIRSRGGSRQIEMVFNPKGQRSFLIQFGQRSLTSGVGHLGYRPLTDVHPSGAWIE